MKEFLASYIIEDKKPYSKAVSMMSTKTDIQRNKVMHLENTLVMYGNYNVEALGRLIKMVHALHSRQTMNKTLFAGRTSTTHEYYSQMHGEEVKQHYAIDSMLYLRTIKDKYIEIYNEFISQLHVYVKVVRILAKTY